MDTKLPTMIMKATLLVILAVFAVTIFGTVMAMLSFVLTLLVVGALIFVPLNILFGQGGAWHSHWRTGKKWACKSLQFGSRTWQAMLHHSQGALGSVGHASRACGIVIMETFCGAAISILVTATALPETDNPLVYVGAGAVGCMIGYLVGWSQLRWDAAATE